MMKDENRKMPTVNLAGVAFYVDATRGLLIDTLNSDNHFHVYELLRLDDHFEMVFDKETRNLKEADWIEIADERYEYLWLRPLGVYDPEGAKECLTEEDLLFLKNLPIINIEGVKFLWEKESNLLFQKDNPWNVIARGDMKSREGQKGIYFDRQKNTVPFPHEMPSDKTKLPPYISFIPDSEITQQIQRIQQQTVKNIPLKKKKSS